jgi:predicted peroxiredoxin
MSMGGAVKDSALVNLATALEDAERVTVAAAAPSQGKRVVSSATKEAVRLGLPGEARGVASKGRPPVEQRFQQFADGGGELWLCPICVEARDLEEAEKVPNARIAGATPVWEWAGDDTTVFSHRRRDPRARGRPRLERRAAPPCSFRDSASSGLRRRHRRPRECLCGTTPSASTGDEMASAWAWGMAAAAAQLAPIQRAADPEFGKP